MQFIPTYKRKTVSKCLRNWLLQYFAVKTETPEWRFLYYIMLGVGRTKDGKKVLLIPCTLLAEFEGKVWSKKYVAKNFLKYLRNRFPQLKLEWSNWDSRMRQARELYFSLPLEVKDRLSQELSRLAPETERVYFLDGTKITSKSKSKLRQESINTVLALNTHHTNSASEDSELMVDYLNSLPSNHFSKMCKKIPDAVAEVLKLPQDKQKRELNILEQLSIEPQQFYTYSDHSSRLSFIGSGLGQLKTPIRKILTHEWIEIDLKNAQLAINAMLWALPETQAFLELGKNWWQELADWLGLPLDDALKKRLKEATYALCYGASKNTIKNGKEGSEGLGDLSKQFFKHSIVKELWKGRNIAIEAIKENGGARDYYGRWISLKNERSSRSILAQIAQSYEQTLIAEVFRFSKEAKTYTALLYQYDGVSIKCKDNHRRGLILKQINNRVKSKARWLGIIIELTW